MREVKFRGRRIDNGKWIYGYLLITELASYIKEFPNDVHTRFFAPWIEVDPATVGQFTGLKDKNGKEIYFDSDIVEFTYQDCERTWQTIIGTVVLDLEFTNSLCVNHNGMLCHFTAGESRNIKILGNVHENLELMKESEK